MSGLFGLIEALVSGTVDLAGNGAVHGGKGMLLAGARRIGWASGSSGRQGKRFSGHSLSSRSLGSGFGGRANLHNYDPKNDYLQRTRDCYSQVQKEDLPGKLFGRPSFDAPDGPLGRYGSKWCRNTGGSASNQVIRPRGNIRF